MKTIAKILASIALIATLAGCSTWTGTGTVTDKVYTPSVTTITMVSCGKNMSCPVPITTGASYSFKLHTTDGDHLVTVDSETFYNTNVGQTYTEK